MCAYIVIAGEAETGEYQRAWWAASITKLVMYQLSKILCGKKNNVKNNRQNTLQGRLASISEPVQLCAHT